MHIDQNTVQTSQEVKISPMQKSCKFSGSLNQDIRTVLMMGKELSPAKVLLQAAYLAARSDIGRLACLARRNDHVLRPEILLRVLLTYLPETVEPRVYTEFLRNVADGETRIPADLELDTSPFDTTSDETATKQAKKLRLLPLSRDKAESGDKGDVLCEFIFSRAYRINTEMGALSQLPELLQPFLDYPSIKQWAASTVYPFVRRNCQYHTNASSQYTLFEFENIPDQTAAIFLLSESNTGDGRATGRDLRGLVAPWLYNDMRWQQSAASVGATGVNCPGWEQVLDTILSWATKSWGNVAGAITDWEGPRDVYFGENLTMSLSDDRIQYLQTTYATTAIACVYSTAESSEEALRSAYQVCCETRKRLDKTDLPPTLEMIMSDFSHLPVFQTTLSGDSRMATFLREDLLKTSNPLTSVAPESLKLVTALTISAYLSTSLGVSWSVRKAGDLLFIGDAREQKGELSKLLRAIAREARHGDDSYWKRSRDAIIWLSNWGHNDNKELSSHCYGPLGMVSREHIETEVLKILLSKTRYSLSREIYENVNEPLPRGKLQDVVYHSALDAFDNASNLNRTRGGLRKCDEIIHLLPEMLEKSSQPVKRVEALLRASHALSDYRLVLKQGEPFSPVVLRVHSDPISIIEKVLNQNPKAYTRIHEFLEMGANMVHAGLTSHGSSRTVAATSSEIEEGLFIAERRIAAMCIEAALNEDDFETAYSYVVSRLGNSATTLATHTVTLFDTWSWAAALKAGQYIRTERSQQPTHLGTASGNLEIRHLEQRIECLAMAIRAAPAAELRQILKSFRRCEEQLDSAIREEAASETAWDSAGDFSALPGNFERPVQRQGQPPRNMVSGAAAKQGEEAPMSLFDLSRATARIAQRNLTALSSLQGMPPPAGNTIVSREQSETRTRKRDQLREAATGTLVSGVGWLIGAKVNGGNQ
ncbi:protein transport protein Sec39, putative [Cordyceps militaris CM01]|uniref:Protein transport protein Sec39, putative n=2 Tax=Cordyceps militaris TaxID=73501 RepID=G3JDA6_CORMM|nr:protein transport protein Sec39, putative [Cordyceps militaris CM01]ATY66893.1 Secretory pathway Sec39 [Cordyceps militaris]EGX92581.1 protein transport protein Sec39, putative [Cordyceps militaris CM01]